MAAVKTCESSGPRVQGLPRGLDFSSKGSGSGAAHTEGARAATAGFRISGFRFRVSEIGHYPHTLEPPRRSGLIVRGFDVEGCGGVAAKPDGSGLSV